MSARLEWRVGPDGGHEEGGVEEAQMVRHEDIGSPAVEEVEAGDVQVDA